MTALSAIAAGLGGLAFFTFIGGAITVARFRGAGFSGTKAVALVPRSDLLATGAEALLLPIIVACALLVPFVVLARRERRRITALAVGAAVALLAASIWLAVRKPIGEWSGEMWKAAAALLVIAGGGACAVERMARPVERGGSRAPATVLLFLVVALFAAALSYALAYSRPLVHAVAILGPPGTPGLSGIFIGESGGAVWLGRDGAILEIPRDQVCSMATGPSIFVADANDAARGLLRALKREQAELIPTVGSRCSGST